MDSHWLTCLICGQSGHGKHFGVMSCRACAAFFKRAFASRKRRKPCKQRSKCAIFDGEKYPCKACRFKKCLKVGMSFFEQQQDGTELVQSVETFVGRPSLVIFCVPETPKMNTFMDLRSLLHQGTIIISNGPPTPLKSKSSLEKLAKGLEKSLWSPETGDCWQVDKLTQEHAMLVWENEFLSAATWVTHFDEFHKLPQSMQIELLKVIWHVWGRLRKVVRTGRLRRSREQQRKHVQLTDTFFIDLENVDSDLTWLTAHPPEKVLYFLDGMDGSWLMENQIETLAKMEPSDVELAFMFAQLCFQYAGNRFQGDIKEITDRFQDVLSDDLHKYYVQDTKNNENYADRLSRLLKINQEIQAAIRTIREKVTVAKTFDVFRVEFSHPEMVFDTGL